ncbi:MAG: hypothetical protein MI921_30045 [Cytophagales bacterium]|nr:hypothetical protein [Cytophagales bacterium]
MIGLINLLTLLKKYFPLLALVTAAVLFYLLKQEKRKVDDFKEVYRVQQKKIRIWKDEAGKNRTRAEIAEITAANARLILKADLKRTIEREVGNLKRNLISYSTIKSSTAGSFHTVATDTIYKFNNLEPLPAKKFVLNKPDLKFNALYVPTIDTLIADYKVIHNFDFFYYYKRPGKAPFNIFKRKRAIAEIKFDNPGSQADSLFTLVLKRRKGF